MCVAGQPLPRSLAYEVVSDEPSRALRELRKEHALRETSRRDEAHLEPYHDQVREAVIARLSRDERAALHLTLAERFAARGDQHAEAAVRNYSLAGYAREAARLSQRAAKLATEALAFDRAADLLELALAARRERRRTRSRSRGAGGCERARGSHAARGRALRGGGWS